MLCVRVRVLVCACWKCHINRQSGIDRLLFGNFAQAIRNGIHHLGKVAYVHLVTILGLEHRAATECRYGDILSCTLDGWRAVVPFARWGLSASDVRDRGHRRQNAGTQGVHTANLKQFELTER